MVKNLVAVFGLILAFLYVLGMIPMGKNMPQFDSPSVVISEMPDVVLPCPEDPTVICP